MCNQVDDCAGNEVSPTEQARGDSGKERKLHRWQNREKTLGETRLSRGASSPPARQISSLFQLQQSQSVSGPLVPGVFPRWMSRWRGPHWRSVSGAHLGGPRRGCHRLFSGVRSSLSFKGRIQTEACVIPNYHGMLIPIMCICSDRLAVKIVRCIIWMLG